MKKDSRGLYRIQITIDGKRKVFSSKDRKKLMLKVAKYRESTSSPSFADIAEEWQGVHWEKIQQGTLRCYNAPYQRLLDYFGDKKIGEITPSDIQRYFAQLGTNYSFKSISNTKTVLNQIFKFATIEKGLDIQNPVTFVQLPKNLPRKTRNLLTEEQIREITNTSKDDFQLAYLIYFTGLRCGEALGLQLRDFDFKRNIINVTKSVHHVGNTPKIGTLKTDSSYRQIPLPEKLKSRIRELSLAPDDYIVSGKEPLTKSALRCRWLAYCKEHGLVENGKPTIDRHQIRHQYTTALYDAGVDLKSMQHILGHSDVHITLQTYTHLTEQQFQNALSKINRI